MMRVVNVMEKNLLKKKQEKAQLSVFDVLHFFCYHEKIRFFKLVSKKKRVS